MHQFPVYATRQSTVLVDTDDAEDEDETEEDNEAADNLPSSLDAPKFINIEIRELQSREEAGRLELQPSFQRGYKWSQKQASLWLESILRGYPCLPEIVLLETEDRDGETQFTTFDGQQRLTSVLSFIKNERGDHWEPTRRQKKLQTDKSFALQDLALLKHLEGCTFKDLTKRHQNAIKNYSVRCAIIPSSWTMNDYLDFFKRIQGGGTPMTDHELRRAIARGPFTELLDQLATDDVTVQRVFAGCKLGRDEIQQLLLRYFQLCRHGISKFGKPSLAQQGLVVMKELNKEMESWKASDASMKQNDLVDPLMQALGLVHVIFLENEAFRRPEPLIKDGALRQPKKVWQNSATVNKPIFTSVVACFSNDEFLRQHRQLKAHKDTVRDALLDLMQTEPSFTDSLKLATTRDRILKIENCVRECLANIPKRNKAAIPPQTRRDLIASARSTGQVCPLCQQSLSLFDDHLHVDHILPRAKGGTNELSNLQVVHKWCNLHKSDTIID